MFQSLEQSLAIATLIAQANLRDPKTDGWFAMVDEAHVPDGTMNVRITHVDAHVDQAYAIGPDGSVCEIARV
jgi:hypothetical protein